MTFDLRLPAAAFIILFFLVLTVHALAQEPDGSFNADEEFSFNVSEFEKSPFQFGGYLQVDANHVRFNEGSSLYRLNFFDEEPDSGRGSVGLEFQPEMTWQEGSVKAYILGRLGGNYSAGEWEDGFTLMEGSVSWQVDPKLYLSAGKILARWGKGYAFSPVNFVGRDKNPSDPDLALEGYWMALADAVFSFPGSVKTIAFTGVALPVNDDVNGDFGEGDDLNWAGKAYILWNNTDIDLLALSEGTRTPSLGVDFSRNITSNLEVHGDWALVSDFEKPVIASDGSRTTETFDAASWLLGIRYLTPTETTFIIEYYRNGKGYTEEEAQDYYDFIGTATDPELESLRNTSKPYQRPNFMRDYLYLRASHKEPFGLLYVTPAVTSIVNVDDASYNIIPEISYTGITNLELRLRFNAILGNDGTEFGEKLNDWKVEGRARYYF